MDIDQIEAGAEADVSLQTLGENIKGSITDVSSVSDSSTGMFDVTVYLGKDCTNSAIGLMADIRKDLQLVTRLFYKAVKH